MPMMKKDVFYDLNPCSVIEGKKFHRVQCEFQSSDDPEEYVVNGVPEGEREAVSFVLIFTGKGRVQPSRSKNQSRLKLGR